jgi:hypothetical protein
MKYIDNKFMSIIFMEMGEKEINSSRVHLLVLILFDYVLLRDNDGNKKFSILRASFIFIVNDIKTIQKNL